MSPSTGDPRADVRRAVGQEAWDKAISAELSERRMRSAAKRAEKRAARARRPPQPERGRFAAVSSGRHRRVSKPTSNPDDRAYVPGALRHWRRVHDLTPAQAQQRVGYSPKSPTWRNWEAGYVCPPYLTLLRIIAATGLGYWTDHGLPTHGVDGSVALEAVNHAFREERRARRGRRREKA